jgi:hypothetical protein
MDRVKFHLRTPTGQYLWCVKASVDGVEVTATVVEGDFFPSKTALDPAFAGARVLGMSNRPGPLLVRQPSCSTEWIVPVGQIGGAYPFLRRGEVLGDKPGNVHPNDAFVLPIIGDEETVPAGFVEYTGFENKPSPIPGGVRDWFESPDVKWHQYWGGKDDTLDHVYRCHSRSHPNAVIKMSSVKKLREFNQKHKVDYLAQKSAANRERALKAAATRKRNAEKKRQEGQLNLAAAAVN